MDAFTTPGTLLKAAREARGIGEREAADRLNLMPGYVAILERDDYQALRSPPFARGYVKAYGKMLGLGEEQLLTCFDQLRDSEQEQAPKQQRVVTRPLQLQRTGLGVVIGLAVLLLLVLALWWWQGGQAQGVNSSGSAAPQSIQSEPVAPLGTGEQ
jgi:cytoskeletal protein RodZ